MGLPLLLKLVGMIYMRTTNLRTFTIKIIVTYKIMNNGAAMYAEIDGRYDTHMYYKSESIHY